MPTAARSGVLDDYVTRHDLATELGVHPLTLLRWHAERRGPPRVKVGRIFYYRRSAIEAWLRNREQSADASPLPRPRGRPRHSGTAPEPRPLLAAKDGGDEVL
jgi:hypothetical protein